METHGHSVTRQLKYGLLNHCIYTWKIPKPLTSNHKKPDELTFSLVSCGFKHFAFVLMVAEYRLIQGITASIRGHEKVHVNRMLPVLWKDSSLFVGYTVLFWSKYCDVLTWTLFLYIKIILTEDSSLTERHVLFAFCTIAQQQTCC